jgi:hypothetical protein
MADLQEVAGMGVYAVELTPATLAGARTKPKPGGGGVFSYSMILKRDQGRLCNICNLYL